MYIIITLQHCKLKKYNEIIKHIIIRGVARIWEGGGQEFFFEKRHAAHGEAMRFARGFGGMPPPRNFFKMV